MNVDFIVPGIWKIYYIYFVAKKSNTSSKLAPEDKRFVMKMGFILLFLLLLSGGALYYYTELKSENKLPDLAKYSETFSEVFGDQSAKDSLPPADTIDPFELPPAPEVPEFVEHSPEELHEALEPLEDDFDIQAHLLLMRQNVAAYNYKQAYKHGTRITSHLYSSASLSEEWGHVLLEAGLPREAVSILNKLNAKDSLKSAGVMDLAIAMFRSGNSDDAIEFLDGKLKGEKNVDFLTLKAAITGEHSDTTKRAGADSLFKQALKINPSLPAANYYYGRYLMQRGNFQLSKNLLDAAVKATPNEPRYVARLGMAEFYLKQDAKAEEHYKKALQINPHDYNTWFNFGELYLSQANESGSAMQVQSKTRMALEMYLETVNREPLHANAHFRIGLILNGNGGHGEAIQHLNMALEKMPNNIPIMQQLSSAYLHLQDTVRSVVFLEKILRIDPFNKIAASEFRRIGK
jgi:tetratricopeptide (TPR) repeat protein